MISLTPYTFQPVTCRLVGLWKNARAVSDWLTFTVSIHCCSCCSTMSSSDSTRTDFSDKSVNKVLEFLPSPVVDPGKACGEPLNAQHVVIDFSPRPEDTDEVQDRCVELWNLINSTTHLKEVCGPVRDSRIAEVIPEEVSNGSTKSKEEFVINENSEEIPAIHTVKQLQAKGAVKAALETNAMKTTH